MTHTVATIANAIQQGKKTLIINGKKVVLPTPQRVGTSMQQRAYAEQSAVKLLN